jgi:hypothetical protein
MIYRGIREMPPAQGGPEKGSKIYRPNFSGPTPENLSMNHFKLASNFTKLPPVSCVDRFLLLISSLSFTAPTS